MPGSKIGFSARYEPRPFLPVELAWGPFIDSTVEHVPKFECSHRDSFSADGFVISPLSLRDLRYDPGSCAGASCSAGQETTLPATSRCGGGALHPRYVRSPRTVSRVTDCGGRCACH